MIHPEAAYILIELWHEGPLTASSRTNRSRLQKHQIIYLLKIAQNPHWNLSHLGEAKVEIPMIHLEEKSGTRS
ncbi:hypothetical protein TNCT_728541 [Trichonephila clavata]|uniref:Uncharacterized protein n=1 Tax=Trichonephila clavata TaxID=2740835 RepID=A0A8X6GRV5_TRICU|nr:hypothetical protein TNCT_728541 [Trichonephila clavata]